MDNEEKPVPAEKPNDFGDLKELIHKYLANGVSPEELEETIEGCFGGEEDEDKKRAEGEKAFGMKFVE